jgi:hypothetical protein
MGKDQVRASLHCGSLVQPMSELGHSRRSRFGLALRRLPMRLQIQRADIGQVTFTNRDFMSARPPFRKNTHQLYRRWTDLPQ